MPRWDNIKDWEKQLSLMDFTLILIKVILEYSELWTNQPNDFHKQKHTFSEWMNSLGGWLSL